MARDQTAVKRAVSSENGVEHIGCIAHAQEQEKWVKNEDESKKTSVFAKTYILRNSALTDMMLVNHLQTVHNITIAVFALMIVNAVLYYLAAPKKFFEDLSIMKWAAGGLDTAFFIWIGLHVTCVFILYPTIVYWTRVRTRINTKVVDSIFLMLWINFLVLMLVIPAHIMRANRVPPITGFAILGEQVRIFMKVYSFVREIAPKVVHNKLASGNAASQTECPTIKKFVYFLFAPCLLYRDSYPRTKKIRWSFVFSHLLQMLACIFILYCLFCRFNLDIFRKIGVEKITLPEFALILAGSMFVGSLNMFVMFYGLLHCWLNAFAEMTRFGDRMFYQDWWNSTSFSEYYRKWNAVVYDWLYAYIYLDMCRITGNKLASMMSVFLISAMVHEYIITIAVGFFFPVLCIMYCTVGVSVLFITKQKKSQSWNILMWALLFSGWGLLVFFYSMEWYARRNCTKLLDANLGYFAPRSWHCGVITE